MAISKEEQTQLLKVVVGLFSSGISATNLSAVADIFEANNNNLYLTSNSLANTPYFKNNILAGKTTIPSQVEILMNNFGLVNDGIQGSASFEANFFFSQQLALGNTIGNIVAEAVIYLSAENVPAAFVDTANLLANKALVSELYVAKNAPDIFEDNVALLANVTQTTLLTEAQALAIIDAFTQVTIDLTADTDNLTGTNDSDLYSGVIDQTGDATTLSNSDILNGAGGTADQLNIRVGSLTANTTTAFSASNIEKYAIKNQQSNFTFTLDFTNISNETQVESIASISGSHTQMRNVDSTATAYISDTPTSFLDINFNGDRTGTDDAYSLSLKGAGSNKPAYFYTMTTAGNDDNSFEIANISSLTTSSNLHLKNDGGLQTINVSGDAHLVLYTESSDLIAVDASTMTSGGLNINATKSTQASFAFTGSSANDRLVLERSLIDTASSLNGGLGTDIIATTNLNNLNKTAINSATGFEILEGIEGAESFSAADFTINEFLFSGDANNNGHTIDGIDSDDIIKFETDISGSSYGLRLEGNNAGTETTIKLLSNDTNGGAIISASNNNNDVYGIEVRSNISTLTIDSTGTGADFNVVEAMKTGNDNGYAIANSATALFKITGSHDLAIMAKIGLNISNGNEYAGFSNAANIDASAFTGALRIAGSSDDDVIKGGTSDDIIYGQGGSDTLTGNSGADQFRLSGFDNDADTILDFMQSTDKIGVNKFDFSSTTQTQSGTVLNSDDYVENRSSITEIGDSEEGKMIELQISLSADQIASDTAASVEAYVLVHNTSTNKVELWYDSDWGTTSNRDHLITFDDIVDLAGVKSFSNIDFVEFSY